MNTLLETLLNEWSVPCKQMDALLPYMSGYLEIHREWEAAERALTAALGEEEKRLFNRYADASLAYFSMEGRASLVAGGSVTLRLLLALLTL